METISFGTGACGHFGQLMQKSKDCHHCYTRHLERTVETYEMVMDEAYKALGVNDEPYGHLPGVIVERLRPR